MLERSVYSLLDFTWLKDLCIIYWTHMVERSGIFYWTWLKDHMVERLKDLCIVYWTSHG